MSTLLIPVGLIIIVAYFMKSFSGVTFGGVGIKWSEKG